jgi:hypothetical protein
MNSHVNLPRNHDHGYSVLVVDGSNTIFKGDNDHSPGGMATRKYGIGILQDLPALTKIRPVCLEKCECRRNSSENEALIPSKWEAPKGQGAE